MYDDWTNQPFVDIVLERSDLGCPNGFEPLFHRMWNGTHDICLDGTNLVKVSEGDEKACKSGLTHKPGQQPINITSIGGMTACGKRGGPALIQTMRVESRRTTCPAGYSPCSEETKPSETFLRPINENKDEFPILDFKVISVQKEQLYIEAGYKMTTKTYPVNRPDTSANKIALSKTTANRGKNSFKISREPAISATLKRYMPCYCYDSDRLTLSNYQMDKIQISMEKDEPLAICPVHEWRRKFNIDKRFSTAGYVSLDLLQKLNNAYEAFNSVVPLTDIDPSDSSFGLATRKNVELNVMTKRRYRWDIYCEKLFDRNLITFLEEVAALQPYLDLVDDVAQ